MTHAAGTIPPPPEPAVIILDGQVIYEHHDVVQLGIAPDGSSFFAVETVTADSFELLIRDLDQGREYRHDIGNTFKTWGLELCYGAYYSPDYSEVHLNPGCPGDEGGMGTHYFYKTGGERRAQNNQDRGQGKQAGRCNAGFLNRRLLRRR